MIEYDGFKFEPWIAHEKVLEKVKGLARELEMSYDPQHTILVGVLNGCFRFMGDLGTYLQKDFQFRFVRVKSYEGTQSGKLRFLTELESDFYVDKHVILIEDIVESGKTVSFLEQEFINLGATSVKCLTLFYKPSELRSDFVPHHIGFEIENKFILGYGLDFNEKGRSLNDVYHLTE